MIGSVSTTQPKEPEMNVTTLGSLHQGDRFSFAPDVPAVNIVSREASYSHTYRETNVGILTDDLGVERFMLSTTPVYVQDDTE